MWVKRLTDSGGNSLQCNLENGGDNQRAQLLVPADKLNMAWQFLKECKQRIPPFSTRENNFLLVTHAHPAKIYVPIAAAHHNLDLIKGLSPAINADRVWNLQTDPGTPGISISYLTPSWIASIRQFLFEHHLICDVKSRQEFSMHAPSPGRQETKSKLRQKTWPRQELPSA